MGDRVRSTPVTASAHQPPGSATRAIDEATRERYRALMRADIRSTAVATVLTLALAVVWSLRPVYAICVSGIVCLGIRQLGRRSVDRDDMQSAILLFAFGLWTSALVILFVLPIGLPVMMFNLVTPVVIAGTFLDSRQHRTVAFGAIGMAAAFGAMAYFQDVFEIDDRFTEWVAALVIITFMVEHTAMFTATVRDANRVSAQNYEQALIANDGLAKSEAELRRSRQRVVDVAERERRRIERDIHDGAQQRIVSAALQLQLAGLDAEAGAPPTAERLDEIRAELQNAVNDLRELASGIYPSVLADHGLRDAIQNVARLNPQTVAVNVPDDIDLSDRVSRAIYFIAVEALQNAAKHAGHSAAVEVTVSIDDSVTLLVNDDGPGFDIEAVDDLGGLANMRDRAAAEAGSVVINSDADGTSVTATIPLLEAAS